MRVFTKHLLIALSSKIPWIFGVVKSMKYFIMLLLIGARCFSVLNPQLQTQRESVDITSKAYAIASGETNIL